MSIMCVIVKRSNAKQKSSSSPPNPGVADFTTPVSRDMSNGQSSAKDQRQTRIENAELRIRVEQLTVQLRLAEEKIAQHAEDAESSTAGHASATTGASFNQLGPFGIEPNIPIQLAIHGNLRDATATKSVVLYEVLNPPPNIVALNVVQFGAISPITPVTLSPEARRLANIPLESTAFAFAYPLAGFGSLSKAQLRDIDFTDSVSAFLALGGYVYFKEGRILQVNGIGIGSSLYFAGPFAFDAAYIAKLQRDGRFQPVTVANLRALGADEFCWIAPGEEIENVSSVATAFWNGAPPRAWEHGAFAYKMSSGNVVYFVIDGDKDGTSSESNDRVEAVEFVPFSVMTARAQEEKEMSHKYSSGSSSNENSSHLCAVCMDGPSNALVLPCRHLSLCVECAKQIVQRNRIRDRKCPMCRGRIEKVLDIFL